MSAFYSARTCGKEWNLLRTLILAPIGFTVLRRSINYDAAIVKIAEDRYRISSWHPVAEKIRIDVDDFNPSRNIF